MDSKFATESIVRTAAAAAFDPLLRFRDVPNCEQILDRIPEESSFPERGSAPDSTALHELLKPGGHRRRRRGRAAPSSRTLEIGHSVGNHSPHSFERQNRTVTSHHAHLPIRLKIACRTSFQYQTAAENTYRLLPRPPQPPAAHFKLYPK